MYLLTTREFNHTNVDFYVDEQNQNDFWVTQAQIGGLLGCYNAPERSIKRLHKFFHKQLIFSFKEVEINIRYKGICKTIVYNFNGLITICSVSNKKEAAGVVNFLWEVKREFEQKEIAASLLPEKNELQLFNYGEKQVRTIEKDSEFWFVAKDVCDILEIKNSRDAIKELYDNEKMTLSNLDESLITTPLNYVNEPGLYKLIFKSRKPEAKKFQDWVFYEVLPSLRKHGMYTIGARPPKMLTGKATDTKFYSADELAAELETDEYGIMSLVSDNDLDIYGFFNTDDCLWYFTEEGRAKIKNAARL